MYICKKVKCRFSWNGKVKLYLLIDPRCSTVYVILEWMYLKGTVRQKLCSFDMSLLKEYGAEIFIKIRPSPMLWEPFKVTASSRTTVGNSEMNSQWRTQNCQRPFTYCIQLLITALWTNLEPVANGAAEKFTTRMLFFSVGNSAMNPPWYLQWCS